MDSPARNPSPPPELREHAELLDAERIGNTAFSKHWLFTTLMKLIEEVDRENEEGKNTDLMVDVDEDLQNELCKLWDMSMNSEVAKFLEEFQAVDVLTGIIDKSKAPRVTEICVGILGNMACDQTVCKNMSEKQKLIEIVLLLLESRDPPTLVETTRLIYTSVSNTHRGPWLSAIQRSEEVLGHLRFIFQSSTNCDLLKNTAELVDVLLDLEPDLCVSWATEDFIQALLEATEQIGSNHIDALEVYLHIFQSFSTTEPGVEALVAHLDFIVGKLMKFLNVVCEYEIVGVDRMEGPLTSALSVLNILFMSQIENKDKHCIQNLCKDEKLIRILLKILEPLYPMLQKYKEELKTNINSNCSDSNTDTEGHVIPADQSETTVDAESTNEESGSKGGSDMDQSETTADAESAKGDTASISKGGSDMDQSDKEEFRQLSILYDVLASFLLDYCRYLFQESNRNTESEELDNPPQPRVYTGRSSKPKESNSSEPKASNSSETKEDNCGRDKENNSSEIKETDTSVCASGNESAKLEAGSEGKDRGENKGDKEREDNSVEMVTGEEIHGDNLGGRAVVERSEENVMQDSAQTEENGSELEKADSSKDDYRIDGSNGLRQGQKVTCLPVLTYLDEACSRCRINNFALTLKSRVEEKGGEILHRIYETAQRSDKERVIRILDDVHAGRVVSRAASGKVLEELDT